MDRLLVCLTFIMSLVYGSATNHNCTNYKQINKENIRNCLGSQQRDQIIPPEKVVNSDVAVSDLELSELSDKARKMKMSMNRLQYLIIPGFVMAGILPWVLPGLQMAVLVLSMINNMAFTSALFAMVRSYVFDNREPDEHIVYINHGYKNKNRAR